MTKSAKESRFFININVYIMIVYHTQKVDELIYWNSKPTKQETDNVEMTPTQDWRKVKWSS